MNIGIFVIFGFLEAGKTTFINRLLSDHHFTRDRDILLLQCEEGTEAIADFPSHQAFSSLYLDSPDRLSQDSLVPFLEINQEKTIIIEYNGMWSMRHVEWLKDHARFLMIADSGTILSYNRNFRNYCFDKLTYADTVVFNRCDEKTNFTELHHLVRGATGLPAILYEFLRGHTIPDMIPDSLPFVSDTGLLEVPDENYALWYRDLLEHPERYNGRRVSFVGRKPSAEESHDLNQIGRTVLACCEDDMFFGGIRILNSDSFFIAARWLNPIGTIQYKSSLAGRMIPVLQCDEMRIANAPTNEIATINF